MGCPKCGSEKLRVDITTEDGKTETVYWYPTLRQNVVEYKLTCDKCGTEITDFIPILCNNCGALLGWQDLGPRLEIDKIQFNIRGKVGQPMDLSDFKELSLQCMVCGEEHQLEG